MMCFFFFFFSSRRRHTRLQGDWSSDVCSSDLKLLGKRDLGTSDNYLTAAMPPVTRLIGGELAWRQHTGGHSVAENWPSFIEWASQFIKAPTVRAAQPVSGKMS